MLCCAAVRGGRRSSARLIGAHKVNCDVAAGAKISHMPYAVYTHIILSCTHTMMMINDDDDIYIYIIR